MVKPRQLLSSLIICSTLFIDCAFAQTTLTQIRDTVYNANGTPFNGTVVITWNGYTSGGTVSPLSTSARIYNGALSVLLVPSTTAAAGTYYQAVYNSNDGTVIWSEVWQVPPSTTPLTLSQVRQSTTQGSGSGNSASGSGGSGGSSGGSQYATLPISISQVTNLATDLNAINNSLSALTTQVNNLQSAVNSISSTVSALSAKVSTLTAGSSAAFADNEVPSGTIDGNNVNFTLAAAPNPQLSLKLYKNGILLAQNIDYTLSGPAITFVNTNVTPKSGDSLLASYRH
jgi:outer membrane murein-binding lipoprotein Lpp